MQAMTELVWACVVMCGEVILFHGTPADGHAGLFLRVSTYLGRIEGRNDFSDDLALGFATPLTLRNKRGPKDVQKMLAI